MVTYCVKILNRERIKKSEKILFKWNNDNDQLK